MTYYRKPCNIEEEFTPKKENKKEEPEKAGPKINTDNYGGGKPVIRN